MDMGQATCKGIWTGKLFIKGRSKINKKTWQRRLKTKHMGLYFTVVLCAVCPYILRTVNLTRAEPAF